MERYEDRTPFQLWAEGLSGELRSFRRLGSPPPRQKFVVFGQGRSGSKLLTTLLDSHPAIRCEGELLRRPRVAPLSFVDRRARTAAPVYGFHLKPYQLSRHQRAGDLRTFLHRLHDRGWIIVHLKRRDLITHAFSNIYARHHGYHLRGAEADTPRAPIEVNPKEIVWICRWRLNWHAREALALRDLPAVPVVYEDDLCQPDLRPPWFYAFYEQFGLPWVPPTTPLRKSVDRPIWDAMINADEVRAALTAARIPNHAP